MDAGWAEAELDAEWRTFLKLAAKSWKADAAVMRLKAPSGAWALGRVGSGAPGMDEVAALELELGPTPVLERDLSAPGAWPFLRELGWGSAAALPIPEGETASGSLWLFSLAPAPRTTTTWRPSPFCRNRPPTSTVSRGNWAA